ncbi:MAG: choline dehydrogenase [Alphaproteobacteria bacterium]|nr:choline dehydrogenase [Alphaproteobacteria bacterium]
MEAKISNPDFIIVGGGSAGCVLANRMTESTSHRVVLLEAGPTDLNPWIHVPIGYGKNFRNPKINWMLQTSPGDVWVKKSVPTPRGKVIGGSSSINGMVYMRGNPDDYNHWQQLGNKGWGFDDVLPYFKKSQNQKRGEDFYHGKGGPLWVSDAAEPHPIAEAYIKAGIESGYQFNPDFNGKNQEGFGHIQWTTKNGRRSSAATAYLNPAKKRKNLSVIPNAQVHKIIFNGNRAIGVDYEIAGRRHSIYANKEILLSAGAIHSPQILQLSGIGSAPELKQLGISVIADLPGVGENLQDHVNAPLLYKSRLPLTANNLYHNPFQKLKEGVKYILSRKGMLAMGACYAGGYLTIQPEAANPDIQALLLLFSTEDLGGIPHTFDGITINVALMRPESRGYVKATDANILTPPIIQPNYLEAKKDRDTLVGGMHEIRRIMRKPALKDIVAEEYSPTADLISDEDCVDFICQRARTSYHPVGTCKMGQDKMAVVDDKLRVINIFGLRVVDASIMPTITTGNTNAPTIMIAEKAADMILADYKN